MHNKCCDEADLFFVLLNLIPLGLNSQLDCHFEFIVLCLYCLDFDFDLKTERKKIGNLTITKPLYYRQETA